MNEVENLFDKLFKPRKETYEEYLKKHYPGLQAKRKEQDEEKEEKIDLNKFF